DWVGNPPRENPPVLVLNRGLSGEIRYFLNGTNLYRTWQNISNPLASHITGLDLELKEGVLCIKLTGQADEGRSKRQITLSTEVQPRILAVQ
ncbi:hypothetical protein, partial [Desulfofundulus sp.]|uniref:hypothetical protein n=1 Tax=Desulfofundulus sp. TaxID=2282750 RepID=UPI003C7459AB